MRCSFALPPWCWFGGGLRGGIAPSAGRRNLADAADAEAGCPLDALIWPPRGDCLRDRAVTRARYRIAEAGEGGACKPEVCKGRDVAVSGRACQPEGLGELLDAEDGPLGGELFENRDAAAMRNPAPSRFRIAIRS